MATTLLNYSKSIYSNRRPRTGSYAVGTGDYMFSLSPEIGVKTQYAIDTFIINSVTYTNHFGWKIGDYHSVSQSIDLTGWEYVTISGKMKYLEASPPSTVWKFKIEIDDLEVVSQELNSRLVSLADFKCPVFFYTGTHKITFNLELCNG